ncbi:metal ABC transporter permease [Apilactobacillus xinyiensis]|uniref:Metal ABC transporter permease n=1 Tax=Apilactobacillus xinyiensis TaxID=2841032 RepID=A0ABT0I1N2_9LACO|nr:metal ABC transporter permease [Apilactobacillus xinyiensis]MCK8624620.1 metal ABC transporter permease [Apilactobacillus xinyiensis]MCL0312512.1 metal ABC transporter permease [Apilactobacillus xinyiensis]MCL0318522.1 metal ABC transporter permease [Apilactobacillus xinyiensis]MCL0330199.1 metal ABC transporter permease [Apilactobacillus xinyiensis]
MLSYPFMQYAFIASFFISLLCGLMGVFVVARKTAFFTHTLSEISFSGASFGVFLGTSPILGMLIFTILSSFMVGSVGSRLSRRESSISVFSVFFIGLGVLFLALADGQSSYATNILFGSIVGISFSNIVVLVSLSIAILVVTTLIYRKLKYNSFDSVGASFNSRSNTIVSIIFLVLLACTVSVTAQIVGSLLIFALLTIPASSAKYFAHTIAGMTFLSFMFSLIGTWVGLYLSYVTNLPVSFFIAAIETIIYLIAVLWDKFFVN